MGGDGVRSEPVRPALESNRYGSWCQLCGLKQVSSFSEHQFPFMYDGDKVAMKIQGMLSSGLNVWCSLSAWQSLDLGHSGECCRGPKVRTRLPLTGSLCCFPRTRGKRFEQGCRRPAGSACKLSDDLE